MAAKDMVDNAGWMEDTASMQSETMLELADAIRDEMGVEQSEHPKRSEVQFRILIHPPEATREALTGGVVLLTGEQARYNWCGQRR